MSAQVRSEFALALNQVATERSIDVSVVLDSIKAAILAAYRKDFASRDVENIDVEVNPNTGEAKILLNKKDITPPGFGRIAAQTAKQVILQRIREAEKKAVIDEYTTRIGSITNGMILRFDNNNIIVDIDKAEAIMPQTEQIPGEKYHLNQRLTFYIDSIRDTAKGNQIIVSRAHKNLILGLFQREVPEVANGAVQIKNIAREAGHRTKIAVFSNQSGVDPVGSCVGQKGIRVQAVINEFSGIEKIDIIQWSENPSIFIQAALAPAKEIDSVLNEKKKTVVALVPEDQLSLAIGRDGQNVRLAGKLTGWRIDIKPKTESLPAQAGKEKETDKTNSDETVEKKEKTVETKKSGKKKKTESQKNKES